MFSGRTARYAAAGVLVVVSAVAVLLFGRSTPTPVVGVIFATDPWQRGSVGPLAIIDVPEGLAPLFITPDGIGNSVATIDIPAGTFLTPEMLRAPGAALDDEEGLSRLRLAANADLWPSPGPAPGDEAVIGPVGSACALLVTELLEWDAEGGTATVAASPATAEMLITTGDLAVWPPAAGTWVPCPAPEVQPPPIVDTPPGTTRMRLAASVALWPAPGPAPGDEAVIGPVGSACALLVTELLDVAESGGVTVAVTPDDAATVAAAGEVAVWPPGTGAWPPCEHVVPEGTSPIRLLVDTTHWSPPDPAAGDVAVIGSALSGCAWMIAPLLAGDAATASLAARPDAAARLMAEPLLSMWRPTTDGTWPFCDNAPAPAPAPGPAPTGDPAADPAPALSRAAAAAQQCRAAGGTWNEDTLECLDA